MITHDAHALELTGTLPLDALRTGDFTLVDDPFALFGAWQEEASRTEVNDPIAMALCTADADGMPDARMVLMKAWDERGFVFYTNFESAKGRAVLASRKAAALFHWKSLRRQIRIRGPVEVVSDAEADAYFHSRARGSQAGAWASEQSRPLASRADLERAVAAVEARYPETIPRPPHWSGLRIRPLHIEFWADGAYRLHDRVRFSRDALDAPWSRARLHP